MLGPDDLPDPGETSQVICGCGSELFRFVITREQILAICSNCGARNSSWPRQPGTEGLPDPLYGGRDTVASGHWPPSAEASGAHGYSTGAAWGSGPGGLPTREEEIRAAMASPPDLPAFSPAVANVYLSGGDYDGMTTWVQPGATEFLVRGMQGKYVPATDGEATHLCEDGQTRPVMVFVPAIRP